MLIRIALLVCVLAFGSAGAVTAVSAGDPYGGFGPSTGTETQEIGTNSAVGAAPLDNDPTLPWLRQQSQHQQGAYGSEETQQGSADQDYNMDDEGGH